MRFARTMLIALSTKIITLRLAHTISQHPNRRAPFKQFTASQPKRVSAERIFVGSVRECARARAEEIQLQFAHYYNK